MHIMTKAPYIMTKAHHKMTKANLNIIWCHDKTVQEFHTDNNCWCICIYCSSTLKVPIIPATGGDISCYLRRVWDAVWRLYTHVMEQCLIWRYNDSFKYRYLYNVSNVPFIQILEVNWSLFCLLSVKFCHKHCTRFFILSRLIYTLKP